MKLFHWRLPLRALAILCSVLLAPGYALIYAQSEAGNTASEGKLEPGRLDSLVAPIALYPDPLLAQILAAATYPLQVVEAERWLQSNSNLKGEKLVQKAAKEDWDPSIQALVIFPSVLQQMNRNLQWTTALGNAFLAQQDDVMAAVQRMRLKAYEAGKVSSNSQQKIEVKMVEGQSVIVIEPANPQVVYVPTYNPTAVYGAPAAYYPYPVMAYPPVVAATAISFGVGVALGAAFHGCCGYSGWGWGCSWGTASSITVNNNFLGRYGYATPYGVYGTGAWKHNPYYRGAVPYSSAAVAGRYGAAAGVRTPYGVAGAVATPFGSAARVRTPAGAAGAVATSRGEAAGVRTPYGLTGAVAPPYGSAAGVTTPYGSADRAARSSSDWAGSRSFSSSGWDSRSAFSGVGWDSGWARSSSDRGFSSLRGGGWGGWGGGGRWGGGEGRRR